MVAVIYNLCISWGEFHAGQKWMHKVTWHRCVEVLVQVIEGKEDDHLCFPLHFLSVICGKGTFFATCKKMGKEVRIRKCAERIHDKHNERTVGEESWYRSAWSSLLAGQSSLLPWIYHSGIIWAGNVAIAFITFWKVGWTIDISLEKLFQQNNPSAFYYQLTDCGTVLSGLPARANPEGIGWDFQEV